MAARRRTTLCRSFSTTVPIVMTWVVLLIARGPASAQPAEAPTIASMLRGESPRPRLVVVVSIDQFRADYLTRYAKLFADADKGGGFKYLMTQGAWYPDARHEHFPLYTGPGHAAILTGGHPYKHGIVGNKWWNPSPEREKRRIVYCVDDQMATVKVVGAGPKSKAKPMGPFNLRSTTVGGELKLATAGRAKVVSLALKDRAAILLGGHAQDASVWFDDSDGRWISSTAFCRDEKLPAWAEAINGENIPDKEIQKPWVTDISQDVLDRYTFKPKIVTAGPYAMGNVFPHPLNRDEDPQKWYRAFGLSPAANQYVLHTARRAVEMEKLGEDDIPDLLAINLSTNDYAGHAFGPYSPELLDLTRKTDLQLGAFLKFLDEKVEGGLKNGVVFALTADHGVSPIPEDAITRPPFGLRAGRVASEAIVAAVDGALTLRYGKPAGGTWFSEGAESRTADGKLDLENSGAFVEGFVYLSDEAVDGAIASGEARDRRDIEYAACEAVIARKIPGVYACFGKHQILRGELGDHPLSKHLARAIHPTLSGDLLILPEQMYLFEEMGPAYATTHGTPYIYDTHVPVMMSGPGIRAGVYLDRVAPTDIAPTLSLLLGIEYPSACDGRPLERALR